jgi:hypothetical protein
MKKIAIALLAILFFSANSFAQCEKKQTYTASKVEFLNEDGTVHHSDQGKVVVEISPKEIMINHNDNEQDRMKGEVKDFKCDWKVPNKDGITTLKAILQENSGDLKDATLSIEGKNGQLTILLNIEGRIVKIYVDKVE